MFLHQLFRWLSLIACSLVFISASYSPDLAASKEDNREKGEQSVTQGQKRLAKKQARINKKLNKLSFKLDKAKNTKKKRLEKRIKQLNRKQTKDNRNPVWGVLPFVITLLALILIVFAFVFASYILGAVVAVLRIAALVLGIIGLIKIRQKPEKFSLKGLAIATITLEGLLLLISLIGLIVFLLIGF